MTGLDLWVGPSCDARALMFRRDPKHRGGMGGMLPRLIVNILTMILTTQIQATILISMTNACDMAVVVSVGVVWEEVNFFVTTIVAMVDRYDLESTRLRVFGPFNQLLSMPVYI
jgi:hypothetical protein